MSGLGRAAEDRANADLRSHGWWILRAPASKGSCDVVALRALADGSGCRVLLVETKRGGYVGPQQWNRLHSEATAAGALPIVAHAAPRKPVAYSLITAPKVKPGRQPCVPFDVESGEPL